MAAQCNMNDLVFRGLSIIFFHCLGLGDGESQLWEAPANLSLSGKRHVVLGAGMPSYLCVEKATRLNLQGASPSWLCPGGHVELGRGDEHLLHVKHLFICY